MLLLYFDILVLSLGAKEVESVRLSVDLVDLYIKPLLPKDIFVCILKSIDEQVGQLALQGIRFLVIGHLLYCVDY